MGFVYGDQVDLRSACESLLSDEALKISALYSRGSIVERCTNTPQTAKEMFHKLVDADLVCSFAIANGPFNCEATFPLPIEQRFSLAYANSLLLYAVFSTICVKIFFAANSKKENKEKYAVTEVELGAPPENGKRMKAVKSKLEQLVPIAPEFYDSNMDDDLIASKSVLLPFNTALLASQLIAFIALMVYYSGPAASINERSIQSAYDYGAPDYNCTPMSFHPYWQNTMNYQWCKDEVAAHLPSETTITNFTDEDAKYWTYTPFSFTDLPALTPDVRALQFGDTAASVRTTFAEEMQTIQGCEDPDSMSFMDLETAGSIPMRIEKHPGLRSTEVSMPQSSGISNCFDLFAEPQPTGVLQVEYTSFGSSRLTYDQVSTLPVQVETWMDVMHPSSCYYRWNEEFFSS